MTKTGKYVIEICKTFQKIKTVLKNLLSIKSYRDFNLKSRKYLIKNSKFQIPITFELLMLKTSNLACSTMTLKQVEWRNQNGSINDDVTIDEN